ncbi:sensor N-terminal transmembrane domain-containing protein [Roseomonas gilardii subsp. gilardii]|nr:sensor N-terminal transmembrane domain-containing protein [Roseomonas gilardii]UPG72966.1 sensor N-terminal transmembrane domain-containing protein [Roseomonas gilardii subsp. gilardii]
MPDGSAPLGPAASPPGGPAHDAVAASARDERPRGWLGMRRNVSPLLRRILLLNALPPFLLATSLLYLDQYQNGLLAGEVQALRTQARSMPMAWPRPPSASRTTIRCWCPTSPGRCCAA